MSNKTVPFSNRNVFKSFVEYWSFAKHLSSKQRGIVFNSLTIEEQEKLTNSYMKDKWDAVFYRDAINKEVDDLEKRYGYNLINIRFKVLSGKSVYLPSVFWDAVMSRMEKFKPENTLFVLGRVQSEKCEQNEKVTFLFPG